LNRSEDEFESARAFNDFLELREIMAMNLVFKTDEAATNRKLREYQVANNLHIDKKLEEIVKPKAAWKKAREDGAADPSGLIEGLKKIVAPLPAEQYDAFQGMTTSHEYFDLKQEYVEIMHPTKASAGWSAGGYNFLVCTCRRL
jgi:hypothetical protein